MINLILFVCLNCLNSILYLKKKGPLLETVSGIPLWELRLSFYISFKNKMNSPRTNMKLKRDKTMSPRSHFCPDPKHFVSFCCPISISAPVGQLLVASLEVHSFKKSTVTLWQMFHSLHFLLISCYLLWNKHGGAQKANRPPVKKHKHLHLSPS